MQSRGSALRVWLRSSGLVLRGLHMRDRRDIRTLNNVLIFFVMQMIYLSLEKTKLAAADLSGFVQFQSAA